MLEYSELTVCKNSDGIPTALGYPINSFMLQNNKPLFVGGGGKKKNATGDDELDENLAVPAGLVCMTQTICRNANEIDANEIDANEYEDVEDEHEIVPEGLYERLMELAETKVPKKMTKRKQMHKHKKTHKNKK